MNIEFTVEDYFNELQSMEKYYGQEEELYPWIYMLLQMVEIRKNNKLKDYDKLCIIDVHKHTQSINDCGLKKLMQNHVPDFAIVDPNFNSLCGYVEIKKLNPNKPLKLENATQINTLKYIFKPLLVHKKSKTPISNKKLKEEIQNNIKAQIISAFSPSIQKAFSPEQLSTTFTYSKCYLDIDISNIDGMNADSIEGFINNNIKNMIHIKNKTINLVIERIDQTVNTWDKNGSQLVAHLKTSRKVLYTDGLVFYYITLNKDNIIHVKEIANLVSQYQNSESSSEAWNNLLKELTNINWRQDPTIKIN